MKTALSAFLLLLTVVAASAQEVTTPAPGSEERTALMDALRESVEPELEQQVIFKIDSLKVSDGWAFMRGVPQKKGGGKINYNDTKYAEAVAEGMFDNNICALFRDKGGEWTVVEFVLGATDVPYVGWAEEFDAPAAIFK